MAHLRHVSIPLEHLVAELAAFPLATVASLQGGSMRLARRVERDHFTGQLWREAELELIPRYPSVSVDELVALRDRIWFTHSADDEPLGAEVPLHVYLRSLARTHLKVRGSRAIPCLQWDRLIGNGLDVETTRKPVSREAWRWQTFALPDDLLLAALGTPQSIPSEVETLSPQWAQQLSDSGFAETHLHLGAGLDFRMLWAATVTRIAESDVNPNWLASPGAEFHDGKDFAIWVLHAAMARYLLAAFLQLRLRSTQALDWNDYLFGRESKDSENVSNSTHESKKQPDQDDCLAALPEVARRFGTPVALLLRNALCSLRDGTVASTPPRFRELQWLYKRLFVRPKMAQSQLFAPKQSPRWVVNCADPMTEWFPYQAHGNVTPEMQFVAHSLDYIGKHPRDEDFARLFWQVVRVRCLFYRHVVLRPMTPGLQWFVRTYNRMGPVRSDVCVSALVESAAKLCGLGQGLKSLEIRTSPFPDVRQTVEFFETARDAFRDFAQRQDANFVDGHSAPYRKTGVGVTASSVDQLACPPCPDSNTSQPKGVSQIPEFGVVVHFIRLRGGGWEKGRPNAHGMKSHAEPNTVDSHRPDKFSGESVSRFRYANFYNERLRQTQALVRTLLNFPLTLTVWRGIDACTDELGVPTWVLVPIFRYLQDVSCLASAWLETHHGWHVPPLRTTVHVGEEFVHLMSGLRRIDEALRYLGLREGDRLGHAIALGTDSAAWAKSTGRVSITREERLWNLVWEWTQYARDAVACPPGRDLVIQRQIERLTEVIFEEDGITAWDMELCIELLHDERTLGELGFPNGQIRRGLPQRASVRAIRERLERLDRHRNRAGTSDDKSRESQLPRAQRCLERYLSSAGVFQRSQQLEVVDTEADAAALQVLQAALRQRVATQGLTVEINPSSNLLIGNLADMKSHPLWRLNSPFNSVAEHRIAVCIGSDDPLTFATHTRAEYMLVHDTLVQNGLSYEEAEQWLDRVRQRGLQNRFTIPQRAEWLAVRLRDFPARIDVSNLVGPVGE